MTPSNPPTAKQFIRNFFHDLEKGTIRYTVLRGYDGLPDCVSNDIDIFIDPQDFTEAERILRKLVTTTQLCSVTSHFGIKKFILNFSGNEVTTLDLFNATSWKGVSFADPTAVIKYTKKYNGITVSKEGTEAAIVILKELLMFGKVKSRNNAKERIFNCLKIDNESFSATIRPFLGDDTEWLMHHIYNKQWREIESNTNKIRRKIIFQNLKANFLQTILNSSSWVLLRVTDKILGKRGCFAVIIGPDGSGKTTLVNAVNKELDSTLFTKTNHYASNFEILPLLSTFLHFLKGKKGKSSTRGIDQFQGVHSGMSQKANSPLRSCIYILWYSFDLILGRFPLWKKKSKGELIFFARYFYDYYYQRANQNAPGWLIDFMLLLVPKPDLVFYIDRSAENIYEQKPELSIEEIKRQQAIIEKLAEKNKNFIRIDGNCGVECSKNQIIESLAQLLAGRVKQ